ncbi:MAG: aminotransferase class III-fold pyridoxal phosphate-dependent enzyme [Pseudomonadota bacterium]
MLTQTQWTEETVDNADRLHLHPNSNPAAYKAEGGINMVRGDGCYLIDNQGNRFFDGIAGLISVPLGYSDQKVIAAIQEQVATLPFYMTHFHMTNEPSAKLSRLLAEITPEGITHFTYSSSGSEANETAIKLAWMYWRAKGQPNKRCIITREQAYHGCAIFTTAISAMPQYDQAFGIKDRDIGVIKCPNRLQHQNKDESDEAFGLRAANWLEEEILRVGAANVAAFIGEPIMGAGGGVQIPPITYWPAIREICNKYDVLLIADEVMAGFGRIGEWFGQDYFGFAGDMMTMSKGLTSSYLPLSAIGISEEIMRVILESGTDFYHGFTAAGHPTTCATGVAAIESLSEQNLIERTKTETGPHFQAELDKHVKPHAIVADVRAAGLFCGVELDPTPYMGLPDFNLAYFGDEVTMFMLQRGFIVRNGGPRFIIAPPLIATFDELTALAIALGESLEQFYELWESKLGT